MKLTPGNLYEVRTKGPVTLHFESGNRQISSSSDYVLTMDDVFIMLENDADSDYRIVKVLFGEKSGWLLLEHLTIREIETGVVYRWIDSIQDETIRASKLFKASLDERLLFPEMK